MTRINSAIPVANLTDEHLLAEHREIKRLPYCLSESIRCGSINKLPDRFTLGQGHVKFFLDKMHFVYWRYCMLLSECEYRKFYVTDYSSNFFDVPKEFVNDYYPSKQELRRETLILQKRIMQRIQESKKEVWHYRGKPLSKQEAIDLLLRSSYKDAEDIYKR
jgi:hypothetical protein